MKRLILTLLLSTIIYPQAWYVDKNATGLNNGTSWTDAWTSFASINWTNIQAGDMLVVSGGTDTIYYNETLTISKDSITVKGSDESGHNGVVVISGSGIFIDGRNNILLSGLSINANVNQGVYIDNSSNIIVDNIKIITDAAGVFVQRSSDITIRYCNIKSVSYSTKQTDGIYSQRNKRININNNYIEIKNSDVNGHNDCIQSYLDGDSTNTTENTMLIWNNVLYQNNTKLYNSSATMMTYGWGWFTFYNNLVVQPYSYTVALGVQQNITPELSNMKCRIWNNTIIAGSNHDKLIYLRRMKTTDTVDVVNNVLYSDYLYQKVKIDDSPNLNIKRWNYNSYYSAASGWIRVALINGTAIDINTWTNTYNRDTSGLFVNPGFTNPFIGLDSIGNFMPLSNSPLIDAGLDISQEVTAIGLSWTDINGNPRSSTPTIGAFEFTKYNPPEIISVNPIDSITVEVKFSEPVISNLSNYSIDNVAINSVTLVSDTIVRLNTTPHKLGFYTLTTSGIKDNGNNLIPNEYDDYTYRYPPTIIYRENYNIMADAETGDVTQFTSIVVDSTNQFFASDTSYKIHGNYSFIAKDNHYTADNTYGKIDFVAKDSLYARAYFYIPSSFKSINTNNLFKILTIYFGNTELASINMARTTDVYTHKLSAYNKATYTEILNPIPKNTPICFEIFYKKGTGTDAVVKVYIDGSLVYNSTTGTGTASSDNIRVGILSFGTRVDIGSYLILDDVVVNDSYIGLYGN